MFGIPQVNRTTPRTSTINIKNFQQRNLLAEEIKVMHVYTNQYLEHRKYMAQRLCWLFLGLV